MCFKSGTLLRQQGSSYNPAAGDCSLASSIFAKVILALFLLHMKKMITAIITAAANIERMAAAATEPAGSTIPLFFSVCVGAVVGGGTSVVRTDTAFVYPFEFSRVVRIACDSDNFDKTISGLVLMLTIPYKICTPSTNKLLRKLVMLEVIFTTPLM